MKRSPSPTWAPRYSYSEALENLRRFSAVDSADPEPDGDDDPRTRGFRSCKLCWWNTWAGVPIRSKASPP
jgi:hypothetical protein